MQQDIAFVLAAATAVLFSQVAHYDGILPRLRVGADQGDSRQARLAARPEAPDRRVSVAVLGALLSNLREMCCDSAGGFRIAGVKDGVEQLGRAAVLGRLGAASRSLGALGVSLLHLLSGSAARGAVDASRLKPVCT